MAEYKATVSFTDPEDAGYVYLVGDPYPRNGYVPADDRIAYLAGNKNRLKKPVIAAVNPPVDKPAAPKKPAEPKNKK